jgi:hypothetical protein
MCVPEHTNFTAAEMFARSSVLWFWVAVVRAVVYVTVPTALLQGELTSLAVRPIHLPDLDPAQVQPGLTNNPLVVPSASPTEEAASFNGDAHTAIRINWSGLWLLWERQRQ